MSDLLFLARGHKVRSDIHHWPGCERDHPECLIQRMADEIERLQYGIRMALECIDGDANDPTGAAQYLRGALKEKRDE